MQFKIVGKFKPAVRMTQRSKFVSKQAQEYLASKQQLGYQLRHQMDGDMYPRGVRLSLIAKIVSRNGFNNCDLSNQLKALEDSANRIVYHDDRWIDDIHIRRVRGEVDVTTLDVAPLEDRHHCPCCGRALE